MNPATRKMLDAIDKFLALPAHVKSGASLELWDVLAALRGPDSQDGISKSGATVPVRRAAFPRCAARGPNGGGVGENATGACFHGSSQVDVGVVAFLESTHFMTHARCAFQVLGIDVPVVRAVGVE